VQYYKKFIRPIIERLDSETLHVSNRYLLHILESSHVGLNILEKFNFKGKRFKNKKLIIRVGKLMFENPLIVGAGWDKPGITVAALYALGFAGVEVGTVVSNPQPGNPRPRHFVKGGVSLNRYGFNNPGAIQVAKNLERYKNNKKMIIGISIGKNKDATNTPQSYADVVKILYKYASYFAINVSSPNTKGLRKLQEFEPLNEIIKAVQLEMKKQGGQKPTFVKIAPDLTFEQIDEIIKVVLKNKITGIIATNTTNNKSLKKKYGWQNQDGGVAGDDQDYRTMSTQIISYIHKRTKGKIIIIGSGGIKDYPTAIEKLKAGASLLQITTGIHGEGPTIAGKINRDLVKTYFSSL